MSDTVTEAKALEVLRRSVLRALKGSYEDEWCVGLSWIAAESSLPREVTRAILAGLREDKLVEYRHGLMTEDGEVAGSGYCLIAAGYAFSAHLAATPP